MQPVGHAYKDAPLVMLDEVDSTNSEAQRRAAAGERGPLWICARSQSQGRGRSGRSWGSPRGSLAATFLFCPASDPWRLPELALVAGVATAETLAGLLPPAAKPGLRIKWPNDILIANAKVSGILVESARYGVAQVAMIGVGINIAAAPVVPDRAVTSLAEHGVDTSPDDLAVALADALAAHLAIWNNGQGFAAIRSHWLERAEPLGAAISVNAGAGPVSGTFAGLDMDGALLLKDGMGRQLRFTFGDVTHVRPTKA